MVVKCGKKHKMVYFCAAKAGNRMDINTTCLISKRLLNGLECKVKMRKMYE